MFKMPCLHIYLKGWINLNLLAQIYDWGMQKKRLDFGDLDTFFKVTGLNPIFKVTGGQRMLENTLTALYLLNELIDFNHIFGK